MHSILALILCFTFYPGIPDLHARQTDGEPRWYLGIQAGFMNSSLNTGSNAANITSSRFAFDENLYPTAGLHFGYRATEFERVQLSLMTGRFSLFTTHEFWPELLFDNQFEMAMLSTQLSLRRLTDALPPAADLYGNFGFGVRNSNQSVRAINESIIPEEKEELTESQDLSLIFSLGAGLNINLSSRLLFFVQYDYNFSNTDIISRDFAGQILDNDFIQTTNRWGSMTTGIRIRLGSGQSRTTPAADFTIAPVAVIPPAATAEEILSEADAEAEERVAAIEDEAETRVRATESEEEAAESVEIPEVRADSDKSETTEVEEELIEQVNDSLSVESVAETDVTESQTQTADALILTEEAEQAEEVISESVADAATSQTPYGLYGSVEGPFAGFTFSIYSFTSVSQAERVKLQKMDEGLRSHVVHAVVRGVDYYRVVIGLFPTLQDARAEIPNLPEAYRENHFILNVDAN